MKNKLLWLAVTVLGIPILAHAFPPNPPGAACTNAPSLIIAIANAVLALLGFGPIC